MRTTRYAALTIAASCALGCAGGSPKRARAPIAEHATRAGDVLTQNAACERCHEDIAREQRASLHRASATDPVYVRAFAIEPLPFCARCHAPEADVTHPEPARVAIGTACTTCHANGATARPCAECHEFPFPDGTGKMQLTATEHRASPLASTSCASCHMPVVGSGARAHKSHAFAASHDPAMLRRAATIAATREPGAIVVRFDRKDVGHALPTGDIFRRLVVEARAGDVVERATLGRKSKLGPDRDDRPFHDGASRAEVRIPIEARATAVAWRVVYERVEHPMSLDESDGMIEGAIEIASGVLPP